MVWLLLPYAALAYSLGLWWRRDDWAEGEQSGWNACRRNDDLTSGIVICPDCGDAATHLPEAGPGELLPELPDWDDQTLAQLHDDHERPSSQTDEFTAVIDWAKMSWLDRQLLLQEAWFRADGLL